MSMDMLKKCRLCPRNCSINRLEDEKGFCNAGKHIKTARADLYFFEEPCISGKNGSGAIFFSNCSLRCVFCQNSSISSKGFGKEITINRLSEIMLELQKKGANNINLISPTHYVPQIIESIKIAKKDGLKIPIVYNSSGYENIETIKSLKGLVDIFLPDFKYFDNKFAVKYSNAPDYFTSAKNAIGEMAAQAGPPEFDENGMMKKGVIIRHLMIPGLLSDSKKIIEYIYKTFGDSVYLSIMNQFTPFYKCSEYPEINRKLNSKSYNYIVDYAISLGIKNAFIQGGKTCSESFIPSFDLKGI